MKATRTCPPPGLWLALARDPILKRFFEDQLLIIMMMMMMKFKKGTITFIAIVIITITLRMLTWPVRRSSLEREQSRPPLGSLEPAIDCCHNFHQKHHHNFCHIFLQNCHLPTTNRFIGTYHQHCHNPPLDYSASASTFFGPVALVLVVPKLNLGFGVAGVD